MSSDTAKGWDFGALLRQRRRAAGLTQAELARRAGLAVRTVRDMERGRTTRPQRTSGVLLADALGLAGEERTGFLGAARGEAPPPAVVPHPRAGPGGAGGDRLWGREAEVAQLAEVVGGSGRPLALVGPAGVGKTALAGAVARRVAGRFPGGVSWLAVDPHGTAAGIRELAGAGREVGAGPAPEPVLLVLDGVEQAPAEVRAALARLPAPVVGVLTTGRAPLGVPGERVWPVPPLALPPAGAGSDLAEVAGYPAVALFLDRLGRVRPRPLAGDEVPALVGLVRRLGGLPLALELAAAQGRSLRLPEILQRYGHRVLDLAGDDGRTLRAAVAGSYRLLGPVEQRALRQLAGFRNWWSLELAEQLLAEAGRSTGTDPVPVLDRLVSFGLVGTREGRELRFRLLDVVRDFAAEQARRLGELATIRRAHAVVVARLVTRITGPLAGPGRPAAAYRLDDVGSEVWAALSHAANDDPPTALRLAAGLPRWWRSRGWEVAGQVWLRRLLADPRTAAADPVDRAWAMVGLARLALAGGDAKAERPVAEAALAEFRRLREVGGELAAAGLLSGLCRTAGRYEEARGYALEVLAVASRHGRARDAASAQLSLAWHEVRRGDLPAARRRLGLADRLAVQAGEYRLRVLAAGQLAELARLAGRYQEAVGTGRRVLARLDGPADLRHRSRVLGTVGRSLAALGRLADAERVLARLRGAEPARSVAGVCAAIEAQLAGARGDRPAAVERLAVAAGAFRDGGEPRDLVEVLVELAGQLDQPGPALAELDRLCRAGSVVLLERERAVLERAGSLGRD